VSNEQGAVLPNEPGPNPAAVAAMAWLQCLERDRFDLAWSTLTNDFRLLIVQDWIVQNPSVDDDPDRAGLDRDELAAELSVPVPTHPLWERGCAKVAERGLRSASTEHLTPGEWSAGERQRPMGPNLELVRVFPNDSLTPDAETGALVFADGAWARVVSLLMLSVPGGWKVAGLGEWLPRPGWPPQYETIVGPTD
jgi:hypothetical protein